MEFKLFEDYITLQALFKELGIIQSGGAIKSYLAEVPVFFNGQAENRRGKKLRIGDTIDIPSQEISITILEPSASEKEQHLVDLAEKARVAALVKKLNQENQVKTTSPAPKRPKQAVKFPGT